jgi:DNA polymerase-4
MRAQNLAAGCVQVKIRRADFTTFTRQKRFEPSTTDSRTVARIAADLLAAWLDEQPRAKVRLLGVGVNHLHAADQLDLFAAPAAATGAAPTTGALDSTVDLIRERFGNLAVRRGSALPVARGEEESSEDASEKAPGRRRVGAGPAARTPTK